MVSKLRSAKGQTFILVMTITALATVLGGMAMSGALMSVRLRSLNRASIKNFYMLELVEKEMEMGLARCSMERYRDAGDGSWIDSFLSEEMGVFDASALYPENKVKMAGRRDSIKKQAEELLEGFVATLPEESEGSLSAIAQVGDISVEEGALRLSSVVLRLTNYERDVESSIELDLVIAPQNARDLADAVRIERYERVG